MSYGGAIYASVPAARFGLRVVPDDLPALIAAGRAVKQALEGTAVARHPDDERLSGIYGTILYDDVGPLHQRNVTIFADGEVDRSPCGSGTSARCALLAADGLLGDGDVLRHDSIVGSTFTARVVGCGGGGRAHRGRGHGLPHGRAPLRPRPARPAGHRLRPAMTLPFLAAADVAERLSPTAAIDALAGRPAAGLDPEADPPRGALAVGAGELLVMPSATAAHAVVKLVTVGGEPRIQGVCVVFDAATLAPVALVDGIALTNVRTPAVSALAVRALAAPDARRLLVFGRGPQAHGHVEAIRAVRPIEHVDMVGRDGSGVEELVARRRRRLLRHHRARAAVRRRARGRPRDRRRHRLPRARRARGRRRPRRAARRWWSSRAPRRCARRATSSARSRAGALREDELVTLADLVCGRAVVDRERPRLFKSTGMAWEDAVVASALVR